MLTSRGRVIIFSWQGTEDTDDGAEAIIGLTFGVFGEDGQGADGKGADGRGVGAWQDLLSLMERVRQRLHLA